MPSGSALPLEADARAPRERLADQYKQRLPGVGADQAPHRGKRTALGTGQFPHCAQLLRSPPMARSRTEPRSKIFHPCTITTIARLPEPALSCFPQPPMIQSQLTQRARGDGLTFGIGGTLARHGGLECGGVLFHGLVAAIDKRDCAFVLWASPHPLGREGISDGNSRDSGRTPA